MSHSFMSHSQVRHKTRDMRHTTRHTAQHTTRHTTHVTCDVSQVYTCHETIHETVWHETCLSWDYSNPSQTAWNICRSQAKVDSRWGHVSGESMTITFLKTAPTSKICSPTTRIQKLVWLQCDCRTRHALWVLSTLATCHVPEAWDMSEAWETCDVLHVIMSHATRHMQHVTYHRRHLSHVTCFMCDMKHVYHMKHVIYHLSITCAWLWDMKLCDMRPVYHMSITPTSITCICVETHVYV